MGPNKVRYKDSWRDRLRREKFSFLLLLLLLLSLLLLSVIAFMQVIYNYTPATNNVSRVNNVTTIQWLKHMVHVMLFPMIKVCTSTLVLSRTRTQCPVWLFSVVP